MWSQKMRGVWIRIQLARAKKEGCSHLSPHQLRRLADERKRRRNAKRYG